MARKRTDLAPHAQAAIDAGVASGVSAEEVARQAGISARTASRRMAEARGGPVLARGPSRSFSADLSAAVDAEQASSPPVPDSGALPTEADIEEAAKGGPSTIDEMLVSFVASYRNAPEGLIRQRWGALILKGIYDRRKATPPERPDPNDAPDLIAAAKRARAMLHTLLETSPEEP
jgi:hypothetical protein